MNDLEMIILKSIKEMNVDKIVEMLTHISYGILNLENLKEIANKAGIPYEEAPMSNQCIYDKEFWLIIDKYILTLSGTYDSFGILALKNITVYDRTDSIVIEKNY